MRRASWTTPAIASARASGAIATMVRTSTSVSVGVPPPLRVQLTELGEHRIHAERRVVLSLREVTASFPQLGGHPHCGRFLQNFLQWPHLAVFVHEFRIAPHFPAQDGEALQVGWYLV